MGLNGGFPLCRTVLDLLALLGWSILKAGGLRIPPSFLQTWMNLRGKEEGLVLRRPRPCDGDAP